MPFGGLQVVLCGDFFQLPPIPKDGERAFFAYHADVWEQLDLAHCYLEEQYRQDDAPFLAVLNAIRAGTAGVHERALLLEHGTAVKTQDKDIPKLFTHNTNVDTVNDEKLSGLP